MATAQALTADDEGFHSPGLEEQWSDSLYFGGGAACDRQGTAFYTRIGRRPNEGRVEGALGIWLRDGRFVLAFGREDDHDEISAGPVVYECGLPFELWRVRVDGVGRAFARAEDVAVARDEFEEVELGGELRYWLYRQYKAQVTHLMDIQLPVTELRSEKNYHDSWELSGGVRVHDLAAAPRLELMAGTQYDHSPAPSRTVALDQPSFTHWGLHSGLRYRFGRYRVGASYIHYWYLIPTIDNSITSPPSNIRGSGTNNIFTVSIEAQL